MLSNQLTTEFFEEIPTVVLVDTVGSFTQYVAQSCAEKGLEVVTATPFDLPLPESQAYLETAYKIVICLSPAHYTEQITSLLENLQNYQSKLYIVIPVISGCEEQVEGEVPYLSQYQRSQQNLIALCNEVLPQSSFIFGQDVLLPPGKVSIFDLCCQSIQRGFIFAPNILITSHTLPAFCQKAVAQILHPHRSSVSIKGRTRFSNSILEKVIRQYENYYFSQVGLQRVEAAELPTIPFSVADVDVLEDEESTALWYSRQLPSPEMEPFFNPENVSFYIETTAENEPSTEYWETPSVSYSILEETPTELELQKPIQPDFWQSPPEVPAQKRQLTETTITEVTIQETSTQLPEDDSIKNTTAAWEELIKEAAPEEFNVSSEIQRIFTHSRVESKNERVTSLAKTRKTLTKKSKKKTTLFYGGLTFISMGGLVLLLTVIFMTTTSLLKSQVMTVLASTPSEVSASQLSRVAFLTQIVSTQVAGYQAVFELPQVDEAARLVEVSSHVDVLHSSQDSQTLKNLFAVIVGSSTGNLSELAQNMNAETLTTYEAAVAVEESLDKISFEEGDASEKILKSYRSNLETLQKRAAITQQLAPLLPSLFGLEGKRTYAFILQNNQELRPTGGFMDAVAILTFENGYLVDHSLYTSYELDKKIPGEVAAPADIALATGEKSFAFYNANWSPDFPTSSATIKWFLEKGLNTTIDGVVTVDLYGLQRILEATGPLELPDYNEVITHKNLLERLEFHSEVVLVETEKNHDYRKVLFSKLLEKIIALPGDKVAPLLSAFQANTQSKAMLVSFANSDEQQLLQNLGWSGSLQVPRCPPEFSGDQCFVDHFMQVEANVGVNKANYYLKRSVDHTVVVSPTQADHTHIISYENIAQLDAWPKGAYKNYIRFYVPTTAVISGIEVGGIKLPASQVSVAQENGKSVVSAQIEVPIKSSKQVALKYSVPHSPTGDAFSYIFFNNEQPGNGDTPYLLRILPADNLQPQLIAPQATVDADGVVFTRNNDETGLFGVKFTQAK